MNEKISSVTIDYANGLRCTISGDAAQDAMQAMMDAFWKVQGTDYEGPCLKTQAPEEK